MRTQNIIGQCPWVGPLPCEEWHATRFYGRTRELKELIPKIRTQDLTVISAASGVGKTSLINAGLIPALRLGRERAPNAIGFALCVRKWATIISKFGSQLTPNNAAQVMIDAITESLKELQNETADYPELLGIDQLCRDLKILLTVESPESDATGDWEKDLKRLNDYLCSLRDAVPGGNLIIVADQAEEYMGSGIPSCYKTHFRELDVFESIIHLKGVRLVISLREEYMGKLRPLEDRFHPLAPRVYHLSPLTWNGARDVIKLSADEETDVKIEEPEINSILKWTSFPLDDSDEEKRDLLPIDMLAVQAFLVDLYRREKKADREMRENYTPYKRLDINALYLDTYMAELLCEEPQLGELGTYLATGPMLRWIDNAFDALDTQDGFLIKRIAANMGTVLSSPKGGGVNYKNYTTEGDLIYHAIRKDLPMCAGDVDVDMSKVRYALTTGKKLRKGGSISSRVVEISGAGSVALQRLLNGNILKKFGTDIHGTHILSMQHDGYAPAFTYWCEDIRRRENDCLAPRIGSYGIQIIRSTYLERVDRKELDRENFEVRTEKTRSLVFENLKDLVWEGCYVRGVKIRNIDFKDCIFTGSFLLKCEFENCEFIHCTFNGSFFSGGTFKDVVFNKCEMKGMVTNDMVWQNTEFINSDLSSAVVQKITLSGRLKIDSCDALYAQIYQFNPIQDEDKLEIMAKDCNLHGALFEDYDKDDKTRFIGCTNTTEFTTKAPKESKSGAA